MKTLQLFKDNKEILGTDGILYVDGRININTTIHCVIRRNERFSKNFPHKVCDSFAIYNNRIGGQMSKRYYLPE